MCKKVFKKKSYKKGPFVCNKVLCAGKFSLCVKKFSLCVLTLFTFLKRLDYEYDYLNIFFYDYDFEYDYA